MKRQILNVWNTVYNWRELWLFPLITFIFAELVIKFASWQMGRKAQESLDFLVPIAIGLFVCSLAIVPVSIFKEVTGRWWSKDDLLKPENSRIAIHVVWTDMFGRVIALAIFAYVLTHG